MKNISSSHAPAPAIVADSTLAAANAPDLERYTRRRCAPHAWLAAVLVGLAGVVWPPGLCLAQPATDDVQGAQVLTRGPVHEAFAGVVAFNPEPGVVEPKEPPAAIEEIPPAERPQGANVAWIPGYWAWDDERNDFLWVSGIWRALPPGRQWIAGYWGQTAQGYQWTSGYWADAAAAGTTYLPAPPPTVEDGPNIAAPSPDYGWTPGTWIWAQQRYAWQPGYWAQGRADWDWMPAHYVWTPRGYVFVGGYWDYSVARRGVLFAPVYFDSGVYSRTGFSYSPMVAIDLALFAEQLFLRPRYHHYYFGDYYAPGYSQGGYYAAYAYQTSRFGYDPLYVHQRWEHREDRDWGKRVEETYQFRRDHETARPPHTWAALRALDANRTETRQNGAVMATSLDQLAKRKDGPLRFQAVPQEDRQKLALQGQAVQKSRDQRRTLETTGGATPTGKPGAVVEPATVKLPKSPIVAKAPTDLKKSEAPPAVPQTPKTDPKVLPKPATPGVQHGGDKGLTQPVPRKPELTPNEPKTPPVQPVPRKPELTPNEPKVPPVQPVPRKPEVTPSEPKMPPVQPAPRKPEVTPNEPKLPPVQPAPRSPGVTPRTPNVQPEPRAPEAAPGERRGQPESNPPRTMEPPANDKATPREREAAPSDKKDKKEPR